MSGESLGQELQKNGGAMHPRFESARMLKAERPLAAGIGHPIFPEAEDKYKYCIGLRPEAEVPRQSGSKRADESTLRSARRWAACTYQLPWNRWIGGAAITNSTADEEQESLFEMCHSGGGSRAGKPLAHISSANT